MLDTELGLEFGPFIPTPTPTTTTTTTATTSPTTITSHNRRDTDATYMERHDQVGVATYRDVHVRERNASRVKQCSLSIDKDGQDASVPVSSGLPLCPSSAKMPRRYPLPGDTRHLIDDVSQPSPLHTSFISCSATPVDTGDHTPSTGSPKLIEAWGSDSPCSHREEDEGEGSESGEVGGPIMLEQRRRKKQDELRKEWYVSSGWIM